MVNTVSLGFSQDYLGRTGLKEVMVRTGFLWGRLHRGCAWSLSLDCIAATGATILKKWCWAFGALTLFDRAFSPSSRHFPVAKQGGLVIMARVL